MVFHSSPVVLSPAVWNGNSVLSATVQSTSCSSLPWKKSNLKGESSFIFVVVVLLVVVVVVVPLPERKISETFCDHSVCINLKTVFN